MSDLTPKVFGPDGVARERFIFTTTRSERFFFGTIDPTTVDMQVSIRGEPFSSNPDLVVFEGESFTVPNPSVYPDGLDLSPGLNVIEIRAVSFSGSVSTPAQVEVTLVQESDVDIIPGPPTNITVERFAEEIEIRAELPADPRVRGMNVYASRFPGGGASGYRRVNLNLVTDSFLVEERTVLDEFEVDADVAEDPKVFLELRQTQTQGGDVIEKLEEVPLNSDLAAAITVSEQERLIKTDFFAQAQIPDTVDMIRTSLKVETVQRVPLFRFRHNRLNGPTSQPPTVAFGEFSSTPMTEPLYYVVTTVAFDEGTQVELESTFSMEVFGNPVTVELQLGSFPVVTRADLARQSLTEIRRTQPQLAQQPGAVIRDTVIDPFTSEAERIRFIVDFLHRAQSVDSLLQIDGVGEDGDSIPVQDSAYKQGLQRAFGNISATQVQALIDAAFEQLGARAGLNGRRPGIRARGLVTFYTPNRPRQTIPIPIGTRVAAGGVQFSTTQEASIPLGAASSFFNPTTGLFSVDVFIQADEPGRLGNTARGQIRTLLDQVGGMQVINPGPTFGGRPLETNRELAVRIKNALAGADSGTEAGYRKVLADVPGIEEAIVVSSGTLMQRDYDSDAGRHVGGKVDIYTRGEAIANVSDTFAFSFETANNVQFKVRGSPGELIFEALDATLSPDNPIAEMLDFPEAGLGLRNASQGVNYNLTGIEILDFKTIRLSSAVPQPVVSLLNDVVLGDYRYVVGRKFVLPRQPVREVLRVVGAVSGELDPENYHVFRLDDPLQDGRSIEAQTYVRIDEVNGNPTGQFIEVVGEPHVMIGGFPEPVHHLGANILTIKVFNEDRTVQFRGPFDPSGISDFTIIPGNQTEAAAIKRVEGGAILSGERVLIDYVHDESFTVEYTTNIAVQTAQEILNTRKHVTADVLVKETVPVPVDLTATVIRVPGTPTSRVDRGVRSNVGAFFARRGLGAPVRQSDVVAEIELTEGVSYVEVPFTKMARQPGSQVIRESIATNQNADVTLLRGTAAVPLSNDRVLVWLIREQLNAATSNGGGPTTEFRAVTQDDRYLQLQIVEPMALGKGPGRAFIIGDQGLSIPGFTDSSTLSAAFPTASPQELHEERRKRTANRVMVSLPVGESPTNHTYTVTYIVAETNAGVRNLDTFDVEYLTVGDVSLTIEEDRA